MTLTLGLVGCGTKNNSSNSKNDQANAQENNQTTETTETTTTPEPEATEVTYPLVVKESDGTEVTIKEQPKKVISVAPNMTELVYLLGAGESLVGRTNYCDTPTEVADIQSIGTLREPNIELIVDLNPDVVLVSTHFSEENEQKLKDLGITVVCLYNATDVYGVYDMITTLGQILNQVAKAEELVADMKKTFDEVSKAVEGKEKPSVYYVVGFGEGGDYTAGGDTFIHGLIELAGGDNIAKDVSGWSYSLEQLLESDPEVIIVDNGMKDAFMSADNYNQLTAVKEGKVYEMDASHLFDRQGYRNAEGVKTLASILYPELAK